MLTDHYLKSPSPGVAACGRYYGLGETSSRTPARMLPLEAGGLAASGEAASGSASPTASRALSRQPAVTAFPPSRPSAECIAKAAPRRVCAAATPHTTAALGRARGWRWDRRTGSFRAGVYWSVPFCLEWPIAPPSASIKNETGAIHSIKSIKKGQACRRRPIIPAFGFITDDHYCTGVRGSLTAPAVRGAVARTALLRVLTAGWPQRRAPGGGQRARRAAPHAC